jgi:ketol-acid reductoisomerase
MLFSQGPAQAQNLRDSLADAKSDIIVKVINNTDH